MNCKSILPKGIVSCVSHPTFQSIVRGQWISLLTAGTGVFATFLSGVHPTANFPFFMSSLNYLLLSSFFIRKKFWSSPEESEVVDVNSLSIWWYALAAIIDVEANYFVIQAYNYTSITSVMLLDCFTIPCAMVLSFIFLGCRYSPRHYIGITICIVGLLVIVLTDYFKGSNKSGSNPFLGDVYCLVGSVLYATSNVLQEYLVKFHNRKTFLGYLGCFGIIFGSIQCIFVNLPAMMRCTFDVSIILCIGGFVLCLFFMYTNTSSFLEKRDAILFNLSLLTSDVYAVIFTYFAKGYLVGWWYFVAFALVILGLTVYYSEAPPIAKSSIVAHNPSVDIDSATGQVIVRKKDGSKNSCRGDSSGNEVDSGDVTESGQFRYNPLAGSASHGGSSHGELTAVTDSGDETP